MYNISLFRISINYTSDDWNFNPFLPPANDVPIPANRTGFLSFMTNSLRTVMTTATINKRSPRMLKARTSSNQPVIKSSSDYISWSWKISTSTLKQTCLNGLNETYYFKVDLRLQGNLFCVSPLASLYIMMIFLFIICDWIDSFSVILYAL